MKLFILLLIFCFYTSRCGALEHWTTEEDFTSVLRSMNASGDVFGIARVRPPGRAKRATEESIIFEVAIIGQPLMALHLMPVTKVLINNETPIWNAKRKGFDGKIQYDLDNEIMNTIGKFELFQDYNNNAAVVLFYNDQSMKGWVNHYRLEEIRMWERHGENWTENQAKAFLLKKNKESRKSQKAGHSVSTQADWIDTADTEHIRTPPDVVYPEILIQLPREDIKEDKIEAVKDMIAYWNGVDMLYSDLRNPRIKINIAGLIIPQDQHSAPWINASIIHGWKKPPFLIASRALVEQGLYFSNLRRQFPDKSYDFMFSFVAEKLDEDGRVLGAANVNIPCWSREQRVAIIRRGTPYLIGAHELAHLLSNIHDDDDTKCQNDKRIMNSVARNNFNNTRWSPCSKNKFYTYFRDRASMCMDNCPSTVKKCFTPRVPSCISLPSKVCLQYRYSYIYNQTINCREDLQCEDIAYVPGRRVSVPIEDWTLADWNDEGLPKVCYAGLDVPYALAPPLCDFFGALTRQLFLDCFRQDPIMPGLSSGIKPRGYLNGKTELSWRRPQKDRRTQSEQKIPRLIPCKRSVDRES